MSPLGIELGLPFYAVWIGLFLLTLLGFKENRRLVVGAVSLFARNATTTIPLAVFFGGLGHLLLWQVGTTAAAVQPWGVQAQFAASEVAKALFLLIFGVVALPLPWAACIYLHRRVNAEGKPATLSGAVNYGIDRYRKVFWPHAAAFITISLGMLIIVPGVVFGTWYAFVDPIAATDAKALRPLKRSQRLTAGVRGRIVRAWLPYAIWYAPAYLLLIYQAEASGAVATLVFGSFDFAFLMVMELVMVAMYDERIAELRKAVEAQGPADGAASSG